MKKTAIFYGSTTGNCESIAKRIASAIGISSDNVYEVSKLTEDHLAKYEAFIFGSSTWGCGEMQDDWYDKTGLLKSADMKGKVIALFGCGDSQSYDTTFCDALSEIYNALKDNGCKIVGQVSTEGYSFSESASVIDGKFIGLALDQDNEPEKSDARISAWIAQIRPEIE